jgi:hypothetical protein
VTANAVVDSGTMPNSPAFGVEAGAGMGWNTPSWRVRVLASFSFFPTQHALTMGREGDFRLLAASGRGCLTATPVVFELGFCVGAEVAAMNVGNVTLPPVISPPARLDDSTQLWFAPVGSALLSWAVSPRIAVFARGDVAAPNPRRSFHVLATNPPSQVVFMQQLYEVPAVATRGALGVEARF